MPPSPDDPRRPEHGDARAASPGRREPDRTGPGDRSRRPAPPPADLRRLWSVDERYVDAQGEVSEVRPETRRAIEAAIGGGVDPSHRPGGHVGSPAGGAVERPIFTGPEREAPAPEPGRLLLESGEELRIGDRLPAGLPLGYHELHPDSGGRSRRVIVSPGRCHLPDWFPAWGWSVQLYALRSRRSWGIGDLADLRDFGRLAAAQGAAVVLVNPLHATAPAPPVHDSPYSPSSRRYLSPLWLRVPDIPGASDVPGLDELDATAVSLDHERLISRDPVLRLKLHALKEMWDHRDPAARERGLPAGSEPSLVRYATFCALSDHLGPDWRSWPAEYRHPDSPAVARYAAEDEHVALHAWAQDLLDRQLADAAAEIGLIQDLPVGFDSWGADAWEFQDLVVDGWSIGAPPDIFNQAGQDWGLPVLSPAALAAAGYEPFIQTIRASLRHAAGLRIDHVMGLFRQWWVPAGGSAADGAYVRFPAGDLLDIVALESHRAGAFVVGEDLGTVEDQVRSELAARGILSYRLLWFEDEVPSRWPACSLGAVSTHDLPTVAGVWSGADAEEQVRLGLSEDPTATDDLRDRLATAGGLADGAPVAEAIDTAHRLLAGAASSLVAVSLDDALAVPDRPNIPGGDGKRPNWSLALPVGLDDLATDSRFARVAELMATRALKVQRGDWSTTGRRASDAGSK